MVNATPTKDERLKFLQNVADSLLVVVAVDLFFSFASYGLSEPYWYFIGGLSVVTARLAAKFASAATQLGPSQGCPQGSKPPGVRKVDTRGRERALQRSPVPMIRL